jgi:hypothetical protein
MFVIFTNIRRFHFLATEKYPEIPVMQGGACVLTFCLALMGIRPWPDTCVV